jgi:hypothetical protein
MKLLLPTILASSTLLTSGCARVVADTYCDIAAPLYFDTPATIDTLLRQDRQLLVDIVVHNETHSRICGEDE